MVENLPRVSKVLGSIQNNANALGKFPTGLCILGSKACGEGIGEGMGTTPSRASGSVLQFDLDIGTRGELLKNFKQKYNKFRFL